MLVVVVVGIAVAAAAAEEWADGSGREQWAETSAGIVEWRRSTAAVLMVAFASSLACDSM